LELLCGSYSLFNNFLSENFKKLLKIILEFGAILGVVEKP
jgi:hypothetical protein